MGAFLDSPLSMRALDNAMPVSSSFFVARKAFVDLLKSVNWVAHEDEGMNEDDVFNAIRGDFKHFHPPKTDEEPGMHVNSPRCI